jgi:hypothetical protein
MVKSTFMMILHKTDDLKKAAIYFFLFSVLPGLSEAQDARMPLAAVSSRLLSYSCSAKDAFSFQGNQASLAGLKNFSAGVYCERRFMLKELSQFHAGIALPTGNGNFGFSAGYAGSVLFNESQLGLAYGRTMGKIACGVQFNYCQLKVQGYSRASSVNFELGAIVKLSEKFNSGFHIYNPTGSSIGKNDEEGLPVIYTMGFGYDVSKKFFAGSEVQKVEGQPVNFNVGLQYSFAENLIATTGVSTAPASYYFGAGYLLEEFSLSFTMSVHQQLGCTPGILLIYNAPAE